MRSWTTEEKKTISVAFLISMMCQCHRIKTHNERCVSHTYPFWWHPRKWQFLVFFFNFFFFFISSAFSVYVSPIPSSISTHLLFTSFWTPNGFHFLKQNIHSAYTRDIRMVTVSCRQQAQRMNHEYSCATSGVCVCCMSLLYSIPFPKFFENLDWRRRHPSAGSMADWEPKQYMKESMSPKEESTMNTYSCYTQNSLL